MRHIHFSKTLLLLLFAVFSFVIDPAIAEARRGGSRSFGGSRSSGRSFGGSKSFRSPSRSFSSPSRKPSYTQPNTSKPRSSFGGSRFSSGTDYRNRYGTPRRSTPQTISGPNGRQNVVVHSYGGMSDGFMMGYMMGHTSWMWMTPFHPAFYYSRPHYVTGANGVTEVYPPTFSFLNLILGLVIIGAILYILYRIFFRRRRNNVMMSDSSFS